MPANSFEVRFDNAILRGEAEGFGLPVVFLHAGVADRRMWREQMREVVAAGYHVIAYDQRGHGETETPDEPFNHLADLEAVLDQLDIHAAIFVGCSNGGRIAIDFALENPNRVIGLVLVGTSVSGRPETELDDELQMLEDARDHALERGNFQQAGRIEAHMWLDGPLSDSGRVEGEPRELFLDMLRIVHEHPKLTQQEEPEPAFDNIGNIHAPTLLIVGSLDYPDLIELHETLSEEIADSFAIVLEDTAHLPNLERPDLFNPVLLEFLDAIAGVSEIGDAEAEE